MMEFAEATKLAELVTLNEQISEIVLDDETQFDPYIEVKGKTTNFYYYAKKWNKTWGSHDFFERVLISNDLDQAIVNARMILDGMIKLERVENARVEYHVEAVEIGNGN